MYIYIYIYTCRYIHDFFSIPLEAREKTPLGAISKIPKKKKESLLFF